MSGADTILFLCVANSSRSQMAEGLARKRAPTGIRVASAGSAPTAVNRFAIQVMKEIGIDISDQTSTSVSDVDPAAVVTVITLCAEEVCPAFLGDAERLHWPLEDPASVVGTEEERLAAFRRVRDQIADRLQSYLGDGAETARARERKASDD